MRKLLLIIVTVLALVSSPIEGDKLPFIMPRTAPSFYQYILVPQKWLYEQKFLDDLHKPVPQEQLPQDRWMNFT